MRAHRITFDFGEQSISLYVSGVRVDLNALARAITGGELKRIIVSEPPAQSEPVETIYDQRK